MTPGEVARSLTESDPFWLEGEDSREWAELFARMGLVIEMVSGLQVQARTLAERVEVRTLDAARGAGLDGLPDGFVNGALPLHPVARWVELERKLFAGRIAG